MCAGWAMGFYSGFDDGAIAAKPWLTPNTPFVVFGAGVVTAIFAIRSERQAKNLLRDQVTGGHDQGAKE